MDQPSQSGFQYDFLPEDIIQTMKMFSNNEEHYFLWHDIMQSGRTILMFYRNVPHLQDQSISKARKQAARIKQGTPTSQKTVLFIATNL